MRFTATVKNNQVVIRDVPLADGEQVNVEIERSADKDDDFEIPPHVLRRIEASERELDAGLVVSANELFRSLGRPDLVRDYYDGAGQTSDRTRSRKLGSTRPRAKSAARRRRRRV